MMQYYKKIDIDDYEKVVEQCRSYISSIDDIYNRKLNATYYPLNFQPFIENCSLIKTCFDRYELVCNFAAVYVSYNNSHNPIHVDNFLQSSARINIPILNCEHSMTFFYTGGTFAKRHNQNTNTNPRILIGYNNLKIVDKVCLDAATVMRVNEPHMVLMSTKHRPRISLTLGFTKDPVTLLDI